MKTTLKGLEKISDFDYTKLTSNLNTSDPYTEVSILEILNSNGIKDAVKVLQTQKYKNYCLFLADVAESVLHIFEEEDPYNNRPRKCIEGIRLYHSGRITEDELDELRICIYYNISAIYSTFAVYSAAYYAAAVVAYYAAQDASNASGNVDAAYYTTSAAYYASSAASNASAGYYASSATKSRDNKWKEIEGMLRKHLKINLLDDDLFVI